MHLPHRCNPTAEKKQKKNGTGIFKPVPYSVLPPVSATGKINFSGGHFS